MFRNFFERCMLCLSGFRLWPAVAQQPSCQCRAGPVSRLWRIFACQLFGHATVAGIPVPRLMALFHVLARNVRFTLAGKSRRTGGAREKETSPMRGWKRFALIGVGVLILLAAGYYGLVLLLLQGIH